MSQHQAATVDLSFVEQAVAKFGQAPSAVIPILQALQDHYGYLPQEALGRVCQLTHITPAAIAGVATFYDMFRHQPVGRHIIQVCHGTACHVAGAERVEEAIRRHLRIADGNHTDPDGQFTVQRVACFGCCTLAPVVRIDDQTIGHAAPDKIPAAIRDFLAARHNRDVAHLPPTQSRPPDGLGEIQVCLDSCCLAKGTGQVFEALQLSLARTGYAATVKRVGCVGACYRTPMVQVVAPGKATVTYVGLAPAQAEELLQRHFPARRLTRRLARACVRLLDSLITDTDPARQPVAQLKVKQPDPDARAFFGPQVHIAMEHYGRLDPLNLEEYLAYDGFVALAKCLGVPVPNTEVSSGKACTATETQKVQPDNLLSGPPIAPSISPTASSLAAGPAGLAPERIIEIIHRSGLRGRGGAGFPTGQKWRAVRQQPDPVKYVICNGDEGDPGAFMDRMLLESFPYRVIEGMAIAAIAVGAHAGIFYIRHEYPQAVQRIRAALAELERRGWLGPRLLGSDYPLRLSVMEGAGAFVCGEETALIASIEGRRGMPRLRPPFPAQSGLWGKPTLINNVETLAVVPWIMRHGPEAFAAIGTATSKGTKVFALAGAVRRAGLIEVPMGTTLRQIVEEIGGGVAQGRRFKAVQIGGPSGGCLPARLADTPVDFEALRDAGAIMGSGGLVVLDDSSCMVDIARYFLQFTQDQSCGKCTFCRIGTKRMLELLDRLCTGQARRADLDELERLAGLVAQGSLCGLGKTAPNPVLTTLRYFRDEYEAHLQGRCPAGKCTALIHYHVTEGCVGCTLCAQHCPVGAIALTPYQRHVIDDAKCTRCDVCRRVCPHHAIEVK